VKALSKCVTAALAVLVLSAGNASAAKHVEGVAEAAALNAKVTAANAAVDARNAEAKARYEAAVAATEAAYAKAQAEYQAKLAELKGQNEDVQRKYASAMDDWKVRVAACKAGDKTQCAH
jgi:hypothetical protein